MTWAEYTALVRTYLTSYATVQGAQDYIDLLIKASAIDLQRTVQLYRTGHRDVIAAADLTEDGYAHRGDVPPGRWVSARIVKYDTDAAALAHEEYNLLDPVGWEYEQQMRAGLVGQAPLVAISPEGGEYMFTPQINDESRLVIEWNGVKYDFDGADEVPFDEPFAEVAADYVMSRLARRVDHDLNEEASYMRSYAIGKRKLLSDALERGRLDAQR